MVPAAGAADGRGASSTPVTSVSSATRRAASPPRAGSCATCCASRTSMRASSRRFFASCASSKTAASTRTSTELLALQAFVAEGMKRFEYTLRRKVGEGRESRHRHRRRRSAAGVPEARRGILPLAVAGETAAVGSVGLEVQVRAGCRRTPPYPAAAPTPHPARLRSVGQPPHCRCRRRGHRRSPPRRRSPRAALAAATDAARAESRRALPSSSDFDSDFQFCRLMYRQVRAHQRGLGWGTDYPDAEINFSIRLSELTKTRVSRTSDHEPNHFVVRPTDDTLFQCPFIIMSDPGSVGLHRRGCRRAARLPAQGRLPVGRRLLGPVGVGRLCRRNRQGPAAGASIRFASSRSIIRSSRRCSRSRAFRRCRRGSTGRGAATPPRWAATAPTRTWPPSATSMAAIMVLMTHNTDISDSWEREGQNPEYFLSFSPRRVRRRS